MIASILRTWCCRLFHGDVDLAVASDPNSGVRRQSAASTALLEANTRTALFATLRHAESGVVAALCHRTPYLADRALRRLGTRFPVGRAVVYALLTATLGISATSAETQSSIRVSNLRCEYRVNPIGMDVVSPRFSWVLESAERGQKQTAYQVLVASSNSALARDEGDLWDSGKQLTDQTTHVPYRGKAVGSRLRAWWKVRVWDKAGAASAWSAPASWEMGLLDRADWQAEWIVDPAKANLPDGVLQTVPPAGDSGALPATMLRKEFGIPQPIRNARAYATALGLYELRINGQRVGDQLLAPEWTDYRKRVQVQTYDVTGLLKPGANAIGALVGEGWYAGRLMAVGRFAYGTFPQFLFQLEIEFENGSKQVLTSDGSWRSTSQGPIRASGIYDGETYDAGREFPGWDRPAFNDSGWAAVTARPLDSRQLVWQHNEPIQIEQELPCLKVTKPKPGLYVLDFGQNMVGWLRLRGAGTKAKTVTIRYGEMLNEDGTLYTANLRGAPQVDRYTPAGAGEFTFEPHFTYHGFRYVEISGLTQAPATNSATGCVFHSLAPQVGHFECSDPSLTQLMSNILWTERANLMSSPNDCPQRDERFGWMGDIQAFAQTAIFNMDLAAFFTKWTQDIRDDQADDGRFPDFAPHPGNSNTQFSGVPAWGDAGVVVPWRAYQNYGDNDLIAANFEAAARWVEYIHRMNPDLIWSRGRNNDYNDWLNGDWIKQTGWPTQGGSVPKELFATAFFAHSTDQVGRMAEVLHREEASRYRDLFEKIKSAFNHRFVKPDGRLEGGTQAGYALALNFDLLPPDTRGKAVSHLVEEIRRYQGHLSTGIQSTHRALLELTRWGHNDTAWQILTNRTFPSWLYMLDNGATTIWERWDGYVKGRGFQDPGMNSFNHWAFGAVGEWMWRHIAGLNPDDGHPGWKHFIIQPRPGGGVTWAKGQYESIHGSISSHWKLEGDRFFLDVTIPANTSATVILPTGKASDVTESGKPVSPAEGVRLLSSGKNCASYECESGRYRFSAPVETGS